MNNNDLLILKKDTDAIATNRGFYYQYLITLNLWLSNFINEIDNEIYCETEDDIFELNKSTGLANFSQIKCYTEGFSQKSPEILKSLFNFFILYLKYKDFYSGYFYFETNAGTKTQAGKFLKDWQNNQEDKLFVTTNYSNAVRKLLENYTKKETDDKTKKIKDKKYQQKLVNAKDEFIKELNSKHFDDFIIKIRWAFLEKDTKTAINERVAIIKDIINIIPHNQNNNLIFARLISEIYIRSSEPEIANRVLTNSIITNILTESESELKGKIHKSIEILVENDFRILDELDKIKEYVIKSYNIINQQFDVKFSFDDFLKTYKSNALKDLSRINFIGLHIPQGLGQNQYANLENIYVKPHFQLFKNFQKKKNHNYDDDEIIVDQNKSIPYSKVFNSNKHIVVLGNPGSGKSVLVKSIICSILKEETDLIDNQEIFLRIPFRIELRKYLAYKKEEKKGNIIKYLKTVLEDTYYIKNIRNEQVYAIIENYPSLIFFDGLDEIFDTCNKNEVKQDIELFINTFKHSLVVVTSRIVGYNEAKLSDEFEEFFILDFEFTQITQYLNKWYSFYLPGKENDQFRKEEIEQFLEQIKQVDKELATNPLLLSLIVIIFSNLKQIPKSKLSIYESCTNTLVSKWDNIKKLKIDINPDLLKYKESIFADLAFWEYERLSSVNKIDIKHDDVIEELCKTIINKLELADDYSLAKNYANDFITYAEKRSLYFENEFTHKTFREYFTAYWIYINYDRQHKIEERDKIITKYISNPFWSIVLELLINMIDKDQGNNSIINKLITNQIGNDNALPFILDILPKIKYISKSVTREIITKAIIAAIHIKKIDYRKSKENILQINIFDGLQKLFFTKDFDEILCECFDEVYTLIQSELDIKIMYFILYYELHESFHFRRNSREHLKISNTTQISDIFEKDINLFLLHSLKTKDRIDLAILDSMIDIFGTSYLIQRINFYFARFGFGYFSRSYLSKLLELSSIIEFEGKIDALRKKGFEILNFLQNQRHFRFNIESIINFLNTNDNDIKVVLISLLFIDNSYVGEGRKLPSKADLELLLDGNKDKDFIIELVYKKESFANKIDLLLNNYNIDKQRIKNTHNIL